MRVNVFFMFNMRFWEVLGVTFAVVGLSSHTQHTHGIIANSYNYSYTSFFMFLCSFRFHTPRGFRFEQS